MAQADYLVTRVGMAFTVVLVLRDDVGPVNLSTASPVLHLVPKTGAEQTFNGTVDPDQTANTGRVTFTGTLSGSTTVGDGTAYVLALSKRFPTSMAQTLRLVVMP